MKKTKNRGQLLLVVLIVMATLAGCRTGRNAENKANRIKQKHYAQLVELAKPQQGLTNITSRTNIRLSYEGRSMNVKGKLKMRRDEAIQMTFTALGLVEVACVEFTPTAVYAIDRIGKRYTRIDYSEGMLKNLGADFVTVQALFWNRLFIPGKDKVWEHPEDFEIMLSATRQCVEPAYQRTLQCHFYTDEAYKQLQQTRLGLNHYEAIWQYGMFEQLGNHSFPTTFDVSFSGSSRTVGAHIVLSNISSTDAAWKSAIDLSRYEEIDLEAFLSILNILK